MRNALNFTCTPALKDDIKKYQLKLSVASGSCLNLSETISYMLGYILYNRDDLTEDVAKFVKASNFYYVKNL